MCRRIKKVCTLNYRSKEGFYYQGEVGTIKSSLLLNNGTNGITWFPKRGSDKQSKHS